MAKKSISVKLQELANSAQIQIQKLANEATEKSFQYNSAEANANRAWQKEMSDTSHQREVKDLKAAGLNPVLSANQGAMSYTSAAASAQAQDASGSVGSLLGSQMSNLANIYQTKVSARATKQAAAAQAAAMRAAASTSAAAQKYAADRHFAAQKYAWDVKDKLERDSWKQKPSVSLAGLIDKHISNTGLPSAIERKIKGFFSGTNSNKLFSKFSNTSWKLNSNGVRKVNNSLYSMGLPQSASTRKLFVQGYIFGNKNSIARLNSLRRAYSKY